MDAETRCRHPGSLDAWLGVEASAPIQLPRWVALDDCAVAYWRNTTFGEAWELTCVHCGLDPYPLHSLRSYLCLESAEVLALRMRILRRVPPLMGRQHALHVNFGIVKKAIRRGELRTLPLTEGEELLAFYPLMWRVSVEEFLRWAAQVPLPRTLVWPERADEDQRSRPQTRQKVDQLVLDIVNHPLRLMKEVKEAFRRRYRVGGRQTPTRVEVERFLIEELGEPPNRKLAAVITKFLAPDTTPHGPRRRPS